MIAITTTTRWKILSSDSSQAHLIDILALWPIFAVFSLNIQSKHVNQCVKTAEAAEVGRAELANFGFLFKL